MGTEYENAALLPLFKRLSGRDGTPTFDELADLATEAESTASYIRNTGRDMLVTATISGSFERDRRGV